MIDTTLDWVNIHDHLSSKDRVHLTGKIMGSQQAYLLRKLRESTLPDNPYMSPLRASDDILRQFPTTYLIVSITFLFSLEIP